MTQPVRTPNPATTTQPERSSKRVAHKTPLAWLPWAALLALLALAGLIYLAVSKGNNHDGATRSTVPSSSAPAGGAPSTAPSTGPSLSSGGNGAGAGFTDTPGALSGALVGGAGIGPIAATNVGTAATGVTPGGAAGREAATAAANSAPGTAGTVLFGSADATADADGKQVIASAAKALKASGAKTVEVRGYTDVVAGAATNERLSRQRADNVASTLRQLLPGVTVTPSAKGQGDPVATNDTRAGRQQNRRVVIAATG